MQAWCSPCRWRWDGADGVEVSAAGLSWPPGDGDGLPIAPGLPRSVGWECRGANLADREFISRLLHAPSPLYMASVIGDQNHMLVIDAPDQGVYEKMSRWRKGHGRWSCGPHFYLNVMFLTFLFYLLKLTYQTQH
jgi:hypothetical protein